MIQAYKTMILRARYYFMFIQMCPLSRHTDRPRICFGSKYILAFLDEKKQYIDMRERGHTDLTKLVAMSDIKFTS